MPAAQKSEKSLAARVEIAQAHADPLVRSLAEMCLALHQRVSWLEAKVGLLDGDGK